VPWLRCFELVKLPAFSRGTIACRDRESGPARWDGAQVDTHASLPGLLCLHVAGRCVCVNKGKRRQGVSRRLIKSVCSRIRCCDCTASDKDRSLGSRSLKPIESQLQPVPVYLPSHAANQFDFLSASFGACCSEMRPSCGLLQPHRGQRTGGRSRGRPAL
jgi:hypothetical protein